MHVVEDLGFGGGFGDGCGGGFGGGDLVVSYAPRPELVSSRGAMVVERDLVGEMIT